MSDITDTSDTTLATDTASTVPGIALSTGGFIPQLGFGVFQIEPKDTVEAVTTALEIGYRHIDTAEMYGNEAEVGEAIRRSGIARDQIFVTSKLNNGFHEPDAARAAFDESLGKLGIEHIDLFLIHWPLPTLYDGDYSSTWQTLVDFHREGRARAIGVSNFQVKHLDRIASETGVLPSVNQIEVHPFFGNEEVRGYDTEHGIVTEAWSPIAQGAVLDDPTVTEIARRVERTPAQVVLRWHVQRGDVVFPKSVTPARMQENFGLFDFELGTSDMAAITGLDRGEAGRTGPNPDSFDYIPG